MKTLFLSTCLLISAFCLRAQDVQMTFITPTEKDSVKANGKISGTCQMKVLKDLPAATILNIYSTVNGRDKQLVTAQLFQTGYPAGQSINLTGDFNIPNKPGENVVLRMFIDGGDLDPTNDTAKISVRMVSQMANDISVKITSPTLNERRYNWTTVPFKLLIKNEGTNDFPTGSDILLGGTFNDQPEIDETLLKYNGPTLKTNDTASVTVNIPIKRWAYIGENDICVFYNWVEKRGQNNIPIDQASPDNLDCIKIVVQMNSINEPTIKEFSVLRTQNNLQIVLDTDFENNENQAFLYDIKGHIICSTKMINGTASLPIDNLPKGAYVVNVASSGAFYTPHIFIK
ncbi:MAG: T9SS type A sorting domain-containing protein [Bacteroidetes bacterium]|nr:T9SS type A sorting domain-containing protein [Bacteroidota bacterium]